MPGVVAAVVAAASWIGAQVAAVAAWTVAGIQIGSFIISSIISFGLSKLLAPKVKGNDRQADTLQLNLGENAREALFGTVATGGQLVDAANKTRYSGYDNGAEILVIKLADHEIEGLVGFYVNDEYVAWTGSGTYSAFNNSFVEGLRVYLQLGTQAQTVPGYITTEWASFWPSTKTMKGCAHVFVEYADTKDRDIWPAGRPRFVWVVKGAKLYDPRKDSTVSGGSGSHRWGTPSTYEWSDNAYLCRYNWVRGIFNGTHLMVGRGLTAIEAPPERAIARANTCDETVSLKAGGTEKRYRANGLVKSTDTAIDVEEWFAAAMAGDLVDRDGVVDIDPGEARTPVWTITDGDMLDGETRVYNRHLGENQRVNTVVARYVEPTQRYEAVAAPMRRDAADVTADGRPYETTLDLQFVQSGTQAQRIAEIKRRQGRLERSFQCTVGPRYIGAESGDWVTLTSDRWLGGDSIVCVITAVQIGVDFKVTLGLREIASSVYSWTAASDELTPGTVVASSTSAPAAISVTSFAAAAAVLTTAAGSVPAIQCTWAAFTDASVTGVLLQVRKSGETTITPTTMSDATVLEAFVTAGVGAQQAMQVRAKAISNVPGRKCNWTSWANVTTTGSTIDNALVGLGGNACVNSEFENGLTGWEGAWDGNTTFTPVRSRVAGSINYVQAVVTGTPANNTVFDIYETDRSLASYWDGVADLATIRRSFMPVTAGQRVFASAPVAYENAQHVSLNLVFHDKDGVDIGSAGLAQGGTNGFPTGGNPALFTIIGGFATAPANAAYVGVYARVVCSGAANPKGYVGGRVQLCVVPDGQTAWPPYSPGPSDKQATNGAIIGTNLLRPDATMPGLIELENQNPNLLRNSSGRLGPAHWTGPLPETVGPFGSAEFPNGGFMITAPTAATYFQHQSVPVNVGDAYSVSGKITLSGRASGSAASYFAWVNSGGSEFSYPAGTPLITADGTAAWSFQNLVAPAGAVLLRQVLWVNGLSASRVVFSENKIERGVYNTLWNDAPDTTSSDTNLIVDQGSVIGRSAVVTNLGTAAAISGQSPLATQTPPSYAGNAAAVAGGLVEGQSYIDSSDGNKLKTVQAAASSLYKPVGSATFGSATSINTSTFATVVTRDVNSVPAGQVELEATLLNLGAARSGDWQMTVELQSGGTVYTIAQGVWSTFEEVPGSGDYVTNGIYASYRALPITGNLRFKLEMKSSIGTYNVQAALWGQCVAS